MWDRWINQKRLPFSARNEGASTIFQIGLQSFDRGRPTEADKIELIGANASAARQASIESDGDRA